MTRAALIVAGTLLCLAHCSGPARAQSAEDSLAVLCPGHGHLAPLVESAASESRIRPVTLVALMYAESTCGTRLVNRRTGTLGLLQILPSGSANPDHLEADELLDPATNLRLGARHLRRMVNLCGALGPALSIYHGRTHCRTDSHARRVLALIDWARAKLRTLRGKRS